jgi:pilus assembly protein CpaB
MTPRTRRSIFLILGSLLLATGAALIANRWVLNRAALADAARLQAVAVVAATSDIPFGAVIEPKQLKTIQILASDRAPGYLTELSEVVGKIARSDIYANEAITERRLSLPGNGSTLSTLVTPTMRAVSIRVDDVVGVGGFILPGNRVDVVAAHSEGRRAWAETVLSDVKVLAVDQQATSDKNAPVVVRAVTVEVSPEGVQLLAQAKQQGSLQLSLRNPADKTAYVPKPSSAEEEVAEHAATAAAAPAVPSPVVDKPFVKSMKGRSVARRSAELRLPDTEVSVIRGTDITRQATH